MLRHLISELRLVPAHVTHPGPETFSPVVSVAFTGDREKHMYRQAVFFLSRIYELDEQRIHGVRTLIEIYLEIYLD